MFITNRIITHSFYEKNKYRIRRMSLAGSVLIGSILAFIFYRHCMLEYSPYTKTYELNGWFGLTLFFLMISSLYFLGEFLYEYGWSICKLFGIEPPESDGF